MVWLFESPGRSVAPVERGKVERLLPCTEGALSVLADIREYIIINTFFMKASYTLLHAAIDGDSAIDGERNCYR